MLFGEISYQIVRRLQSTAVLYTVQSAVVADRSKTSRHISTRTNVVAAVASAPSVSNTNTAATMNVNSYIKSEVETPPELTARPDVASGSLWSTDTTITDGGRCGDDGKTTDNDATSWSVETSAVNRRLASGRVPYKYKDNIKQRFCSEGDSWAPCPGDRKSYSSSSDGASSAPDFSPSSSPAVTAATVGDNYASIKTSPCRRTGPTKHTPAFVLHPSGTYYVPVIVATAQMCAVLGDTASDDSAVVCHPVSIPVRFTDRSNTTAEILRVSDIALRETHRLL